MINNLIGIDTGAGYRLRVPVKTLPAGAIFCAAEVPIGSTICLMNSTAAESIDAAEQAARLAIQNLYGSKPAVALFFDCPASRLRMGEDMYNRELQAVQDVLKDVPYIGMGSHGQIVRTEGQYNGFHNCVPLICLIPE